MQRTSTTIVIAATSWVFASASLAQEPSQTPSQSTTPEMSDPTAGAPDPTMPPTSSDQSIPPTHTDPVDPTMSSSDPSDPTTTPSESEDPSLSSSDPTMTSDPMAESELDRSAGATTPGVGVELDDQKIDQFANAYMEVQSIQQRAESQLQGAADPAAADQVRTSAESDMIAAVERSGLDIEEFNEIVEAMASDVEVRNRVAEKIQERSGG